MALGTLTAFQSGNDVTFDYERFNRDFAAKDHAIPGTSDTAKDDTRSPTWLRVIAWLVSGLLGFVVAWIVVATVTLVAFPQIAWGYYPELLPVILTVWAVAALVVGLVVGWFVGRGNVLRPQVGFQRTTNRLTADRSTTELHSSARN